MSQNPWVKLYKKLTLVLKEFQKSPANSLLTDTLYLELPVAAACTHTKHIIARFIKHSIIARFIEHYINARFIKHYIIARFIKHYIIARFIEHYKMSMVYRTLCYCLVYRTL